MSNMQNTVFVSEPHASTIPNHLDKQRYIDGYFHGWQSNHLKDMRRSFLEGFRRAKLEIREYWRSQGVSPIDRGKQRFKITTQM